MVEVGILYLISAVITGRGSYLNCIFLVSLQTRLSRIDLSNFNMSNKKGTLKDLLSRYLAKFLPSELANTSGVYSMQNLASKCLNFSVSNHNIIRRDVN